MQPDASAFESMYNEPAQDDGINRRAPKRKRRDMRACAPCRRSKVKCDGNRPCSRCANSGSHGTLCVYPEVYKDPTTERLESLELEVSSLRTKMENLQTVTTPSSGHDSSLSSSVDQTTTALSGQSGSLNTTLSTSPSNYRSGFPHVQSTVTNSPDSFGTGSSSFPDQFSPGFRQNESFVKRKWRAFKVQAQDSPHAVARGFVSHQLAFHWYQSFFSGSHIFVPVFDIQQDTFTSVARRSSFLFDAIIAVGCRSEEGPSSTNYQRLQSSLRERTANLILNSTDDQAVSLETIQALLVVASYSENGWVLSNLALRLAMQMSLPTALDNLMTNISARNRTNANLSAITEEEKALFRMARVWWGAFNLEHM
jgi:hypothetical protein